MGELDIWVLIGLSFLIVRHYVDWFDLDLVSSINQK